MYLHKFASIGFAVAIGVALVTVAPPASAADPSVPVDCGTGVGGSFSVTCGSTIDFDLSASSCSVVLGSFTQETFQSFIDTSTELAGTGGTVVAHLAAKYVSYTAGPLIGTDTLTVQLPDRALFDSNDYSMTSQKPNPEPWFQAVGRGAGVPCPFGWNPSWAEWPNNNTGGFVCVRTQVWDNSAGDWTYKRPATKG
jgi:hypothetical protein